MSETKLHTLVLSVLAATLLSACATPREELSHFGYAASTPLRDFNIIKTQTPAQLAALQNPFGISASPTCQALTGEINALQSAIDSNNDRYVGFRRNSQTRKGNFGNARDVGVASAATYWIPFRGLVRQISGAAKRDQQADAANNRARYRIGYLAGQARAYRCPGFA